MNRFNEWLALSITRRVGTMACAYAFSIIAIVALPQAIHDSFYDKGFQPLPLVTWTSQSFLQLTLLAIIMVGQGVQSRKTEERDNEQFNAVMEILKDARDERAALTEIVQDERIERQSIKQLVHEMHQVLIDVEDLEQRANRRTD
jgi:hypothetical protein